MPEPSEAAPPVAMQRESGTPHLSVHLRHQIGALAIDVRFALTQPWSILFGPSGCGKTTILRVIAGLVRPDFARVVSTGMPRTKEESSVTFVDTHAGIFLPAHKRNLPLADQKANLFPHLTVLENLTYGYPIGGSAGERDSLYEMTANLATLFQIEHVLGKRPAELSGGEARRVCLARAAMARRKHILLLDEPFTGLDLRLRDELIADLRAWQSERRIPILSVTHNVAEAFQLNAEVIKLSEGRIVQQGPVEVVLAEERTRLLAQLNATARSPA